MTGRTHLGERWNAAQLLGQRLELVHLAQQLTKMWHIELVRQVLEQVLANVQNHEVVQQAQLIGKLLQPIALERQGLERRELGDLGRHRAQLALHDGEARQLGKARQSLGKRLDTAQLQRGGRVAIELAQLLIKIRLTLATPRALERAKYAFGHCCRRSSSFSTTEIERAAEIRDRRR